MAAFADDHSDVEKGRGKSDTFETLVAQPDPLPAATFPPPPAVNDLTPEDDNVIPSTTSTDIPKIPDWTKTPKFGDLSKYTQGFPRLAAQQALNDNGSIHRRFEPEGEFLITYREYGVTYAAVRLSEWYSRHPEAGQRLSSGQKNDLGNASMEELDVLVQNLEHAWLRYHTLLMAQREKRTLHSVHQAEVKGLYGSFLASQDMTDDDVFLPAYAHIHDFCSTALHPVHMPVRNMLNSPLGGRLQEKIPFLKFSADSGGYLLSSNVLGRVLEMFQVFFTSSLLLIPTGILLFGQLDKSEKFGVVVASVFIFCAVVVLGRGGGGGKGEAGGSGGHGNGLLHGVVAAYTAVLATFLAQLGS